MVISNVVTFKRLFSLRQHVGTPSEIIDKASRLDRLKSHKLVQSAQSHATQTGHKLAALLRGPVRSSLLVSWELARLVAAEQKLVPQWSTWPQARQVYAAAFESARNRLGSGEIDGKFVADRAREITWGQAGGALRVAAEMAAFYYIGEVVGMVSALPFK